MLAHSLLSTMPFLVSMLVRFVIDRNMYEYAREDERRKKCTQAILNLFKNARQHHGQSPADNRKFRMSVPFLHEHKRNQTLGNTIDSLYLEHPLSRTKVSVPLCRL